MLVLCSLCIAAQIVVPLDFPDDREQMNFMVLGVFIQRHLPYLLNPLVPLLFVLPLFLFFIFVPVLVILAFRVLIVSHSLLHFAFLYSAGCNQAGKVHLPLLAARLIYRLTAASLCTGPCIKKESLSDSLLV